MIWCHHFVNENKESSQKLWEEYLQGSPQIYYQAITEKAFETNDDGLINNLIEVLQSSETGKVHLEGAHSCLLSIYIRKNQLDDALKVFRILKNNEKWVNRKVVLKLKEALKAAGKEFPNELAKAKQ